MNEESEMPDSEPPMPKVVPDAIVEDTARTFYEESSGDLSNVARNLAIAGLAIIWGFYDLKATRRVDLPLVLKIALVMFVATLILDIFQYLLKTILWGRIYLKNQLIALHKDKDWPWYDRWIQCICKWIFLSEDGRIPADIDGAKGHNPWSITIPALACFFGKIATLMMGYACLLAFFWDYLKSP